MCISKNGCVVIFVYERWSQDFFSPKDLLYSQQSNLISNFCDTYLILLYNFKHFDGSLQI